MYSPILGILNEKFYFPAAQITTVGALNASNESAQASSEESVKKENIEIQIAKVYLNQIKSKSSIANTYIQYLSLQKNLDALTRGLKDTFSNIKTTLYTHIPAILSSRTGEIRLAAIGLCLMAVILMPKPPPFFLAIQLLAFILAIADTIYSFVKLYRRN